MAFWNDTVVRPHNEVVRYRASPPPGHDRPQLPLATEAMRCLHPRQQQSGTNRADARNLAQYFHRLMFPALGQKFSSHLAAQTLQSIQVLIEQFRSAVHAGLPNLVQPLLPIARGIDVGPPTGNAPAKPGWSPRKGRRFQTVTKLTCDLRT